MRLVSPKGTKIVGTCEIVEATAGIADVLGVDPDHPDRYDIDWEGYTEIIWETQQTMVRDGQRVFVDEEGNTFRESELTLESDGSPDT